MNDPITITTTIDAAPETVWAAFTEPGQVTGWNYASPEWHCPHAESDLREGGHFSYRMEAKGGSVGFDFGGQFTRVRAPEELHYRIGDGREVQVQFERLNGGRTRVTEQFEAEATNPREMQQGGWQAILGNFKAYVEGKKGP